MTEGKVKGRLVYIDPNELATIKQGVAFGTNVTPDNITWNPEDLNMSIDLQVVVPEREGSYVSDYDKSVTFNIQDYSGYASFLRGTKVAGPKGDCSKNGETSTTESNQDTYMLTDSYLDASYTEIKNGNRSNMESLGITSIDITFDQHFYPQVTMNFVDVRGYSLMMPNEYSYANRPADSKDSADSVSCSNFFKALFNFPYPRFLLTVKGFFGTKITFMLAVNEFKTSLNASTGNFDVTVTFIGYMYGLYTDIPLNMLIIAPYIGAAKGEKSEYWNNSVNAGNFCFDDGSGNGSVPMMTFIEFMQVYNMMKVNMADQEKSEILEKQGRVNAEITALNNIKNEYGTHCANMTNNPGSGANADLVIEGSQNTLILTNVYNNGELKYNVKTLENLNRLVKEYNDSDFHSMNIELPEDDRGVTVVYHLEQITDNDPSFAGKISGEKEGNLLKDFNSNKVGFPKGYVYCHHHEGFVNKIQNKINDLNNSLTLMEEDVRKESVNLITQALGFTPSLYNIYRMLFAHLDAFMHEFFQTIDNVKTNGARTVSSYGLRDMTDLAGRSVSNASAHIPPFPAVYKKDNKGKRVRVYPLGISDVPSTMEELQLVEKMIDAGEMVKSVYMEDMEKAKEALTKIQDEIDRTQTFRQLDNYCPIMITDIIIGRNPYTGIVNDITGNVTDGNNAEKLLGGILTFMANRVRSAYFLGFNYGTNAVNKQDYHAGMSRIEAENFLLEYPDMSDNADFLAAIDNACKDGGKSCLVNFSNSNPVMGFIIENNLLHVSPKEREKGVIYSYWHPYNTNDETEDSYRVKYDEIKIIDIYDESDNAILSIDNFRKNVVDFNCDYDKAVNYRTKFLEQSFTYDIDGSKLFKTDNGHTEVYHKKDVKKDAYSLELTNNNHADNCYNIARGTDLREYGVDRLVYYRADIKQSIKTSLSYVKDGYVYMGNFGSVDPNKKEEYRKEHKNRFVYYFLASMPVDTGADNGFWSDLFTKQENESIFGALISSFNGHSTQKNRYVRYPKTMILYLGSILYLMGADNSAELFARKSVTKELGSLPSNVKQTLKEYFVKWMESDEYDEIFDACMHIDSYDEKDGNMLRVDGGLSRRLCKFMSSTVVIGIIDVRNHNDENLTISFITKPFLERLRDAYASKSKQNASEARTEAAKPVSAGFNKLELKTALYYSMKNLYDKWVSTYHHDRFRLNTVSEDDELYKSRFSMPSEAAKNDNRYKEFNNFMFSDSFYNDIRHDFIVNPETLYNVIKDHMDNTAERSNYSMYQMMSEIAEKNKLLFIPLPVFNNYYSANSIKDIFMPHYNYEIGARNTPGIGTTFMIMYPYEPSYMNGDNENIDGVGYHDDRLDFNDERAVVDIYGTVSDRTLLIPAFAVSYGQQNQQYFKNITVNMDNPRVTDYSIANTFKLAELGNNGAVNEVNTVGNDLYSIYSNRSYNCQVEMMGCANIMPMMYFQLNNIPMFQGAYMISNVRHNITPGNFTTYFSGVRMSRYAVPLNQGIINSTALTGILQAQGVSTWSSVNVTRVATRYYDSRPAVISDANSNDVYNKVAKLLDNGTELRYTVADSKRLNAKLGGNALVFESSYSSGSAEECFDDHTDIVTRQVAFALAYLYYKATNRCVRITSCWRNSNSGSLHSNKGGQKSYALDYTDSASKSHNNVLFSISCQLIDAHKDIKINQIIWEDKASEPATGDFPTNPLHISAMQVGDTSCANNYDKLKKWIDNGPTELSVGDVYISKDSDGSTKYDTPMRMLNTSDLSELPSTFKYNVGKLKSEGKNFTVINYSSYNKTGKSESDLYKQCVDWYNANNTSKRSIFDDVLNLSCENQWSI